jgi:hypothetical protein
MVSFTYGFMRRCQLCRQHVEAVPNIPGSYCKNMLPYGKGLRNDGKCQSNSTCSKSNECRGSQVLEYWSNESRNPGSRCRCLILLSSLLATTMRQTPQTLPVICLRTSIPAKRVINVGPVDGSQEPYLHLTSPLERGAYCTLSYRWPLHAVTLTQENISKSKQAIPLTKLLQTLQDAIIIARKLGFKFIWIDAMCIIQGLRSD